MCCVELALKAVLYIRLGCKRSWRHGLLMSPNKGDAAGLTSYRGINIPD